MPNRIIKESIHTSEDVNRMTDFQFRLWISLITYVDDYGRGDARPAIIKGACFPLRDRITNKDIDAALRDLAGIGCVSLYEVDGKPYLYFPTWESHQRIQTKKSRFPAPPHGEPPLSTVNHGEPPPESNPNPNTNTNTNPKESAPTRHAHGQYGWVKLTDSEYSRLLADLGETELARCIAYVDESAQSTGNKNKWKDWNLTVRKCHRDGWGLNRKYTQAAPVATADRLAEMIRRGDFDD
nr:MAG TPA: replisome organizer [Bacteriophage sp.]